MRHILVACDNSLLAKKAFTLASDFALHYQAEMTILSVIPPVEIPEDIALREFSKKTEEHFQQLFISLKEKTDELGIKAHFITTTGQPADQIIQQAKILKVDHIVIGYHEKSLLKRFFVDSVAEKVIVYAPCSMTLAR